MQQKVDEKQPLVDITELVRQLNQAWANTSPNVLAHLTYVWRAECTAISLPRVATRGHIKKLIALSFRRQKAMFG